MNAEMESRLQELIDERDIRQVMMLYCRGVDRKDRELIEGTFHPDAISDGTDGVGAPTGRKRADDLLGPSHPNYTHFIGNQIIEVKGNDAKCEFYFISISEVPRDGEWYTRMRGGRYIGRLERRDGQWKFIYRTSTDDWSRLDRVVERVEVHPPKGLPSREDPVYKVWESPTASA